MRNTITAVDKEIIQETNSHRLRGIDSTLQQTIAEMLSSTTQVAQVAIDHHPFFGAARGHMILSNATGHSIQMNLRSEGSGVYHVLSYSTSFTPKTNSAVPF